MFCLVVITYKSKHEVNVLVFAMHMPYRCHITYTSFGENYTNWSSLKLSKACTVGTRQLKYIQTSKNQLKIFARHWDQTRVR